MSCSIDSECGVGNIGYCFESECFCTPFYRGNNCEISFFDVSGYIELFWTMAAIAIIGQLIVIIGISFTIHHLRKMNSLKPVNSFILGICLTGSILRLTYYAFDPHQVHNISPDWLDGFWYALALVCWTEGFLFMLVQWADVAKSGGFKKNELLNSRGRIAFIFVSILLGVLQLTFALYEALMRSYYSILIYDATMILALLLLFAGTIFLVLKFRNLFASIKDFGEGIKRFSNRLHRSIALTDISMVIAAIVLVIGALYSEVAIVDVIQHVVFRLCEILALFGVVIFLYIPAPTYSNSNRSIIRIPSKSDNSQSEQTSPKFLHTARSTESDEDTKRYDANRVNPSPPPSSIMSKMTDTDIMEVDLARTTSATSLNNITTPTINNNNNNNNNSVDTVNKLVDGVEVLEVVDGKNQTFDV